MLRRRVEQFLVLMTFCAGVKMLTKRKKNNHIKLVTQTRLLLLLKKKKTATAVQRNSARTKRASIKSPSSKGLR